MRAHTHTLTQTMSFNKLFPSLSGLLLREDFDAAQLSPSAFHVHLTSQIKVGMLRHVRTKMPSLPFANGHSKVGGERNRTL